MLNKINKLPELDLLNLFFRYEDGKLIRNVIDESNITWTGFTLRGLRRWNSTLANLEAGHEFTTSAGTQSKQVRINNKMYYVHRIIYKLCTGLEPDIIDHINGNPVDNRIENLRSVSNAENSRNASVNINNTSGVSGVSWSKSRGKWEAYIWDKCKKINLGRYEHLEEAVAARTLAESELNYHENHGRSKPS